MSRSVDLAYKKPIHNKKPIGVKNHLDGLLKGKGLFNFARALLAVALPGEGFLRAPLFSWFQVERVTLDFFYDIFLLYFTFEAPKGAFQGLAILEMDFRQKIHHLPYGCVRAARRSKFYCSVPAAEDAIRLGKVGVRERNGGLKRSRYLSKTDYGNR